MGYKRYTDSHLENHRFLRHGYALIVPFVFVQFLFVFLLNLLFLRDERFMTLLWNLIFIGMSMTISHFLFKPIFDSLRNVIRSSILERKQKELLEAYPHVVCTKHRTRCTIDRTAFLYKQINCRISHDCKTTQDLEKFQYIVAVIGYSEDLPKQKDCYYFEVWDEQKKQARSGDVDALIIQRKGGFEEYDLHLQRFFAAGSRNNNVT